MMRFDRLRPGITGRFPALALCVCATIGVLSLTAHGRQIRTVTEGVYSSAQAARGQQIFQTRCAKCHGGKLEGGAGPPLADESFLAIWSGRPLAELVEKIEKTMPPEQPGSVTGPQAIDLAAYVLQSVPYPAGSADLAASALTQIAFSARSAAPAAGLAAPAFTAAGNLAQLMRAVTFPNSNVVFNVQVKDPGTQKPSMPVPFDYVAWGSTVYYGWQAVDQAALALVETSPLFLLPGRRCENGRPVPVDRADWKQFTAALVDAGRATYRASQSRDVDAVVKAASVLNDSCANCHKVFRDVGQEGNTSGADRCKG
jgi:mono/diheme cytochrome c family protein